LHSRIPDGRAINLSDADVARLLRDRHANLALSLDSGTRLLTPVAIRLGHSADTACEALAS